MRQAGLLPLALVLFFPATGLAQDAAGDGVAIQRARTPNIAAPMLDPAANTRFHLTSRFSFSRGDETFSDDAVASLEAKFVINAAQGVGIAVAVPAALEALKPGKDNFLLGNIRIGAQGGARLWLVDDPDNPDAPRLGVGGALDVYLPTSRDFGELDCGGRLPCDPNGSVRNTRSYEPELYMPRTAGAKLRLHTDFSISIVMLELELGMSSLFRITGSTDYRMFFSWMLRAAVRPIDEIEPYLEIGSALKIVGDDLQVAPLAFDNLSTPVLLTVGLRFHAVIDPALFVSFNLADGGILFGIDLAAVLRNVSRTARHQDPFGGFSTD